MILTHVILLLLIWTCHGLIGPRVMIGGCIFFSILWKLMIIRFACQSRDDSSAVQAGANCEQVDCFWCWCAACHHQAWERHECLRTHWKKAAQIAPFISISFIVVKWLYSTILVILLRLLSFTQKTLHPTTQKIISRNSSEDVDSHAITACGWIYE